MNRSSFLLGCAACLLMIATVGLAQQRREVLSFEPGGPEACAKDAGSEWPEDLNGPAARLAEIICGERDIKIEEAEFAKFGRSMARKGSKEATAFRKLMDAFYSYRGPYLTVADNGCGGGNGCGADEYREKALLGYRLLIMLEGFRKKGLPHFTASDQAAADASLNTWYKDALDDPYPSALCDSEDKACQSEARNTFRDSQRAWLRYRDAWVTFGALVWPRVSGDSWRCYLTRERLKGSSEDR